MMVMTPSEEPMAMPAMAPVDKLGVWELAWGEFEGPVEDDDQVCGPLLWVTRFEPESGFVVGVVTGPIVNWDALGLLVGPCCSAILNGFEY
jgi:hypothetical protein